MRGVNEELTELGSEKVFVSCVHAGVSSLSSDGPRHVLLTFSLTEFDPQIVPDW